MQQPGRKSTAGAQVVAQLPSRMLEPPVALTDAAALIWRGVVATKPQDWFQSDTVPLLTAYCRDAAEADKVSKLIDSFDPERLNDDDGFRLYKELVKMRRELHGSLASLSVKLRIAQSSSTRQESAITKNARAQGKRPWAVVDNE